MEDKREEQEPKKEVVKETPKEEKPKSIFWRREVKQ